MRKNILIINSGAEQEDCLFNLFAELKRRDYALRFLVNSAKQKQALKKNKWPSAQIKYLPRGNNNFNAIFFVLCLPLFFVFSFTGLIWQRIKHKINIVICFSAPEKILFTLPAKLLKINIIWFELIGQKGFAKQALLKKIYKINAKHAKILILNSLTKANLLSLDIPENNIFYLPPGLKKTNLMRQENIFSGLAKAEQTKKKKYFTVGTILPAAGEDKIETLCQAIKNCLSVIHNLQLIILGKKTNKQNLDWFTKKIGINNAVWFVGEPALPGKWLSNFDVFVFTGKSLSLPDYFMMIKAAALNLPIIAPENIGADDIVFNERNGYLLNIGDSEILSQAIIRLRQNPHLRKRLGEAGRDLAANNFQLDKMTEQFISILNLN